MFVVLDNKKGWRDLTGKLPPSCSLRRTKKEQLSIALLDSFDWRLYRAGYTLKLGDSAALMALDNNETMLESDWQGRKLPQWPRQFKESKMAEFLHSVLDFRALIMHCRWHGAKEQFELLNEDRKTIARGWFYLLKSNTDKALRVLRVEALRGYEDECATIFSAWKGQTWRNDLLLFERAGVEPGAYAGSRPKLDFSDEKSLANALRKILRANFNNMLLNEKHLIADTDAGFLHDYRVCGRRMRSALSRIKGVLKEEKAEQLKSDLKRIGDFTGPVRDWDVFLLREGLFRQTLQSTFEDSLNVLLSQCRRRRGIAFGKLQRFMAGKEYEDIIARTKESLAGFDNFVEHDADLRPAASAKILKHYSRVVKQGKNVKSGSDDEAFHALRISCKKLRYLLEFFYSLYSSENSDKAIKLLKKIQDNLGALNDMSVQEELLLALNEQARAKKQHRALEAASALLGYSALRKQKLREEFRKLYKAFASSKTERLYKESFKENG